MAGFKIPKIPTTTNKTIRFPDDLIEEIESAIAGKECTFSAFVIAAVRNALEELKEEEFKLSQKRRVSSVTGTSAFEFIKSMAKLLEDNFENLYLWDLGYEYEYLHYQFSFLHFSDKNHDDDRIKTQNSQATEFVKLNLKQVENLADALKIPALWELSAWAVLTSALKSELFVEAVEKHCGFKFDKEGFIKLLEG